MYMLFLVLLMNLPILAESPKPLPYIIPVCLSCGDALGENTVTLVHADRELKFCCLECVSPYAKTPDTFLANLEAEIAAIQRKDYPLTTCVVTGRELGSMGEPVELVYGNTLVRFCCAPCIEKFQKDPEQYLKKLEPK